MISYVDYITPEEYMDLRKKVGWVQFPLEEAKACIDNAYMVLCVRDDEKAIGVVRLLCTSTSGTEIKCVFIDIFQCKSEYEFYHSFASAVIKQTSSKLEEWVEMARTFLSNISPKFSFGSDPLNDFSLSFEWNPQDDTESDILQLPEKIAQKKGIRIVVCLDEFQQIADFSDAVTFQKKLRSVWQHQQNVTYCMFGSKKHLMENIFNDKSMPFYKFGDMMFLKKIDTEEWVDFICKKFNDSGKSISSGDQFFITCGKHVFRFGIVKEAV